MTRRLYIVLADFLDRLASSSEPVEVGQAGPVDRYSQREAKLIGPTVGAFATSGMIKPADVQCSCRPSRHRAIVRRWLPLCRESCRQKALEFRRRAERLDDDGNDLRQPTLF